MLLNIYLGISFATFILFTLEIGKLEHKIKMKFKDRFKPEIDKKRSILRGIDKIKQQNMRRDWNGF